MLKDIVPKLRCPCCRETNSGLRLHMFQEDDERNVDHGVVVCPECGAWFPISNGLLQLVPPALIDRGELRGFDARFSRELKAARSAEQGGRPRSNQSARPSAHSWRNVPSSTGVRTITLEVMTITPTCPSGGSSIRRPSPNGTRFLSRTDGCSTSGARTVEAHSHLSTDITSSDLISRPR